MEIWFLCNIFGILFSFHDLNCMIYILVHFFQYAIFDENQFTLFVKYFVSFGSFASIPTYMGYTMQQTYPVLSYFIYFKPLSRRYLTVFVLHPSHLKILLFVFYSHSSLWYSLILSFCHFVCLLFSTVLSTNELLSSLHISKGFWVEFFPLWWGFFLLALANYHS